MGSLAYKHNDSLQHSGKNVEYGLPGIDRYASNGNMSQSAFIY